MKGKAMRLGETGPRGWEAAGGTLAPTRLDLIAPLLQAIPDAIIALDPGGCVVFANAAAASAWNIESAESLPATPLESVLAAFEMLDTEGRPVATPDLPWTLALSGAAGEKLIRFRSPGPLGNDRFIQVKSQPAFAPSGEVLYAINIFRDVTEQERAGRHERFLARASDLLAAAHDVPVLLQSLADHVVSALADLCLVDLRERGGVARVAMAHRDPAQQRLVARIAGQHSDEAEAGVSGGAGVAEVLRSGEPRVYATLGDEEAAMLSGDPRLRDLLKALRLTSLIFMPLSVRGETIGVLTLATGASSPTFTADDVAVATELARRASVSVDNAQLHTQAQDGLRSREDLLAIVSHDLRNPLGVVLTSSALLLRAALPTDKGDRARRQVEAIQRAGNRMNRLIRDLLDLGSIQGGQLVLTYRTQDARSLVVEAVESLQPLALRKSQLLVAVPPADALVLSCDHERMIQVFANVVGNAMKFSPEGAHICVSVAAERGAVRFTVSDDGPGMTPEELRNMFDRSWQAKRKNRDGIGLGLSIVKGIVERHGGRVSAESTVGAGTTVHFNIPSSPPPASFPHSPSPA